MATKTIPALSFNMLTPLYDLVLDLLGYGGRQREKVVDLLQLKPNETLLDVGCGTGTLSITAKKRNQDIQVSSIDVDAKVLEIAKRKAIKEQVTIQFVQGNAAALPFESATYDVVVSTLIFHHLPTEIKQQAIKEIYRVLKGTGRFMLVDFGKAYNWYVPAVYRLEKLLKVPEAQTAKDNIEGKIPSYLQEAGFTVQEIASRYRGLYFWQATK